MAELTVGLEKESPQLNPEIGVAVLRGWPNTLSLEINKIRKKAK